MHIGLHTYLHTGFN